MKSAGAFIVDPWTREMQASNGIGSCTSVKNLSTGEELLLQWRGFYLVGAALLDRREAIRDDYAKSTWVRIAAESEDDACRAAVAAVIFTEAAEVPW